MNLALSHAIAKTQETMRVIRQITGLADQPPRPAYTPDPTAMKGVATRRAKARAALDDHRRGDLPLIGPMRIPPDPFNPTKETPWKRS